MLSKLAMHPQGFLALIPNLTTLHVRVESSMKRVVQIASIRKSKGETDCRIKPIKRVIICGRDRKTLLPHSDDLEKKKLIPEIAYMEDEVSVPLSTF